MPCFMASHLGLLCLPMSYKKDAKHNIWVNLQMKSFFLLPIVEVESVPHILKVLRVVKS